jgi:formylglycine-generating enzyme required for sulfatase activity
MVWIAGGAFHMGSDAFYPQERPAHLSVVAGFWIDAHPVTTADFLRFVDATDYVTVAERPVHPAGYPDADPGLLVPGSLVFRRPSKPVPLHDYRAWWSYVPGASWRHPEGPDGTLDGREHHPVTHVAFEDALAYARWAGKDLPTEAEWEFAARGGLHDAVYVWGDDFAPDGRMLANTWQGRFPWENLRLDGFAGTSPVAAFPPNGYGLYDMAGNVWEWTSDVFTPQHARSHVKACCTPARADVAEPRNIDTARHAPEAPARRVIKGGSHLCAPNYCLRYRPAARQGEAVDTSTCHLGFRCVRRPASASSLHLDGSALESSRRERNDV